MKGFIKDFVIALILAILIIQFIKPTIIKESSMLPTLQENNYVLLSKQAYTFFGDLEYGDIIVFHTNLETANGAKKDLVKRVQGLPGDVITVKDGIFIRNGEVIIEDYLMESYTTGYVEDYEVPEGMIFVMGDNRRVSLDSRNEEVGPVPIKNIAGKVVLRVYPFNEFGRMDKK